jgi:hypothetical protein
MLKKINPMFLINLCRIENIYKKIIDSDYRKWETTTITWKYFNEYKLTEDKVLKIIKKLIATAQQCSRNK